MDQNLRFAPPGFILSHSHHGSGITTISMPGFDSQVALANGAAALMPRSCKRVKTSHVGALPRPDWLPIQGRIDGDGTS